MTIAVTAVTQGTPHYYETADSLEAIECRPELRAIATGEGSAQWEDAKIRWYFGTDRTKPADSSTYSGYDIRGWWGKPLMAKGDTAVSDWHLWGGLPFTAEFVFAYSSGTRRDTASVRITCGPVVSADVARPVVDMPTLVAPHDGDLQPGDTVEIQLTASAAGQLWESEVGLGGACDTVQYFPERMKSSVTRTVRFVIPASCTLKSELGATELAIIAGAFDAGGRGSGHVVGTGRYIVDQTPPTIAPRLTVPRGSWQQLPAASSGGVFAGESLTLDYLARDNRALAMMYWEEAVSGQRDSIAVQGTSSDLYLSLPVGPEWVGSPQLRFWARDVDGLTSDTLATPVGAITVLPTTARATDSAKVAGDVEQVAYDATRGQLYLAEFDAKRVAVFSLATMTVTQTIDLSSAPASLDLTASGDSLVAALPDDSALAVIDLRPSPAAITRLPITARVAGSGQTPRSVRVLADGHAWVALGGYTAGDSTIVEVDLATGTQRVRADAERGGAPARLLERSADRRVLVVNDGCFQRYAVGADAFTPCVHEDPTGAPAVLDSTGSTVAVGPDIFDASLTFQRYLGSFLGSSRGYWYPVALSPDASIAYTSADNVGVVRFRASDGAALDRTLLPFWSPRVFLASEDGKYLFFVGTYGSTSTIAVMHMQ